MNARNRRRRFASLAALVLVVFAGAGCGNLTAGGFTEMTVEVSGDHEHPTPVAQASLLLTPPSATSHQESDPEGEVEVDFRLELITESGGVLALTDDDIRVKIDLGGANRAEVVRRLVPAEHYSGLRLTFTHIQVEVEGLIIDGELIQDEVRVEIEGPGLVVTRPIDLVARSGESVFMVVDLNTPAWLEALDPSTLTVDPGVFAELVDLVVE